MKITFKVKKRNPYVQKIKAPIYKPRGVKPLVKDLIDRRKADELIAAINKANLPKKVAKFLRNAAERHVVFRFDRIAEYYAHASPRVQALMEDSALVIIDFDKALENGFIKLDQSIMAAFGKDHPNAR